MFLPRLRHCLILTASVALLAGCSGQSSSSDAGKAGTPEQHSGTRNAGNNKAAKEELSTFHKLLKMHSLSLAVSIGEEIQQKYPDSAAAKEVSKKLPELKAQAGAEKKKQRLQGLWLYQVGPVGGGTESTASIYNSKPEGVRVHLVLRRQTEWGTSAFLYDKKDGGFVCHKQCDVVMHFDGKRHVYKGYLPDGGEPAMFIKNYKRFIKQLAGADTVKMKVRVKGKGAETLVYETGGYQADQWKPLP